MRTLGIKEIMATIPHRQPFLLVDKAEIIEEGKKAGVATPWNDVIYKLLKIKEASYTKH